jgi:RNA-splicing ligase RtcB
MADLKIFTENIEQEALNQIYTLVKQPAFSDCKIRIMPDVHAGAGCVIGFTADLGEKVIPNIVGVDIGCGMLTTNLGNIDIDFERLDKIIREYVPSGRKVYEEENTPVASDIVEKLHCKEQLKNIDWIKRSCGTLGGGNHFIEVDNDSKNNKYLIIHSGSRNVGKQLQKYISKWRLTIFRENQTLNKIARN